MRLTRKQREPTPLAQAKQRRDSALRRLGGAPAAVIDQAEQRRRRRLHMAVVYDGEFDLTAEATAILEPVAQHPDTTRYPQLIGTLTLAVHELVLDLGKLLVERDARHRTADLPHESRGRAVDLIVAAWERPACPVIERDALTAGTWSSTLVDHTAPISEPLAAFLHVATPPGQTRGAVSVSERVESALRELDRIALETLRTLDRLAATRPTSTPQLNPRLRHLGASPDELRRYGITT